MNLLDQALALAPIPAWTKRLHLSRDAIAVAKNKGKLTPVIAGALAVELHEDPTKWIALATLESAPESPAKEALLKKLKAMRTW
jgi:hypothetical protein